MMALAPLIWLCLTTALWGGALRVAAPAVAPSGQASSAPTDRAAARQADVAAAPQADRAAVRQAPAPVVNDRFAYHGRLDVAITAAAAAVWIVAEADKAHLAARSCKWCDRASDGTDTLNGLDAWGRRALLWNDTGRAATASDITAYVAAPAASYGLDWWAASKDGRASNVLPDGVVITQSMAIASSVTELLKYTVARERPFVHVLTPEEKAATAQPADNNTSFPSGHTTLAFSLVTASGTIAGLRAYSRASWIWWAGMPAAALTAYFRVAADRHYVTDVLAGAAVGSAAGVLVPYLGHRRETDKRVPVVRVMPAAWGGRMVAAQWIW